MIQSFVDKADKEVEISIQQLDPKNLKNNNNSKEVKSEYGVFRCNADEHRNYQTRWYKKIGYVHIWSYAGEQYQQLLEEEIALESLKRPIV